MVLRLSWPFYAWYIMSIISVPVYLLVFVSLLRLRSRSKVYKSSFYTILIQHSIADLLAMLIFGVTSKLLMFVPFLRMFCFKYQEYYIPDASYNSVYYFLYIRCCGIVLLSFQRFLSITLPMASLTLLVQKAPNWKVVSVYWIIPTVLSILVLKKDTDFQYADIETLTLVVPKEIIMKNTQMALIILISTCILCSFFYTTLVIYIRLKTVNLSGTIRREIHLAAQVFLLLLAFFVMMVFYSFQNYFSQTENTDSIFLMRSLYPIANGFLSYINPFCILFLNREIAAKVYQTLRYKKFQTCEIRRSSTNLSQFAKNVTTRTMI